ncbi:MAG: hypothetical protein WBW76_06665 [Candidatus Cybelea sp.]
MRTTLGFFVLAAMMAAPAVAQSMSGMDAMQYYVGTWSCQAGAVGQPASNATATYTLDSGVLRGWVNVPPQGKMTTPYVLNIATTYDSKSNRYVQTQLDNQAHWSTSFAQPWTGSIEQWTDQATADGKLGRSETIRTNQNSFSFDGYPSMAATQPDFKGSCTRSS